MASSREYEASVNILGVGGSVAYRKHDEQGSSAGSNVSREVELMLEDPKPIIDTIISCLGIIQMAYTLADSEQKKTLVEKTVQDIEDLLSRLKHFIIVQKTIKAMESENGIVILQKNDYTSVGMKEIVRFNSQNDVSLHFQSIYDGKERIFVDNQTKLMNTLLTICNNILCANGEMFKIFAEPERGELRSAFFNVVEANINLIVSAGKINILSIYGIIIAKWTMYVSMTILRWFLTHENRSSEILRGIFSRHVCRTEIILPNTSLSVLDLLSNKEDGEIVRNVSSRILAAHGEKLDVEKLELPPYLYRKIAKYGELLGILISKTKYIGKEKYRNVGISLSVNLCVNIISFWFDSQSLIAAGLEKKLSSNSPKK